MFERDWETWMWLADSGASHHMTSVRRDFCEYRALTDRLWMKGISARAVGVGSVRIIVKADYGEKIPAMLKNVVHVPELSRRAPWSYHRLFSLTQARRQGLCVVLHDLVDQLRLHAGHDGGVVVPLVRAHMLVWLPARVAVLNPTASVATAPLEKRLWSPESITLASRSWTGPWPLWWRVWRFLRRRGWASVRHVLCVSRTSVVSLVSRLTGMLVSLRS
jgi:hypothetical protein